MGLVQALEEGGGVVLPAADPPDAVLDEKGVEDDRPDIEGVVGLDPREHARGVLAQDGARQEHAQCLAADRPVADHPVAHGEQVIEGQVALDQPRDGRLVDEHQLAQALEPERLGPGVGPADQALRRDRPRAIEHPLPVTGGALVLQPWPTRAGQDLGDRAAVRDRTEALPLPGVDQVHHRGGAVLDLDRPDIETVTTVEDIQQELGGVGDRLHRRRGVGVPVDPEIGHGVQIEQAGAGEAEEVGHHPVRLPGLGEVGEAIEDIHGLGTGRLDHRVDLIDEGVEAIVRPRVVNLGVAVRGQQGRMGGEAEIDQPPLLAAGRLGIGGHQGLVVIQPLDLPDDVVTTLHPAQDRVESGQPGGGDEGQG